jgi:DNA-binding transcriptional ArsR family regulator
VLKEAGLVRERRSGTRNYYSIDGDGLAELREYFENFWEEALAAFKEAAEKGEVDEFAGDQ